ncbi:scabin-related ADP-ribosyltransferase [Veronia pacifica]|uniref:scabin-related ADP-ribosyltransferase n=1 Tax=Veronia pacifica TaxID=1080227 RepID=UPI001112CEF1|nr:hypothetical protein [Veronia pacifica]
MVSIPNFNRNVSNEKFHNDKEIDTKKDIEKEGDSLKHSSKVSPSHIKKVKNIEINGERLREKINTNHKLMPIDSLPDRKSVGLSVSNQTKNAISEAFHFDSMPKNSWAQREIEKTLGAVYDTDETFKKSVDTRREENKPISVKIINEKYNDSDEEGYRKFSSQYDHKKNEIRVNLQDLKRTYQDVNGNAANVTVGRLALHEANHALLNKGQGLEDNEAAVIGKVNQQLETIGDDSAKRAIPFSGMINAADSDNNGISNFLPKTLLKGPKLLNSLLRQAQAGNRRFISGDAYAFLNASPVTSANVLPPNMLFRGDTRNPDNIFSNGLKPRAPGVKVDIVDHVLLNRPSNFVPTSKSQWTAADFVGRSYGPAANARGEPLWVYEIDPRGLDEVKDVNVEVPNSEYSDENEVVVDGNVPGGNIVGATPVYWDQKNRRAVLGGFVMNPLYTNYGALKNEQALLASQFPRDDDDDASSGAAGVIQKPVTTLEAWAKQFEALENHQSSSTQSNSNDKDKPLSRSVTPNIEGPDQPTRYPLTTTTFSELLSNQDKVKILYDNLEPTIVGRENTIIKQGDIVNLGPYDENFKGKIDIRRVNDRLDVFSNNAPVGVFNLDPSNDEFKFELNKNFKIIDKSIQDKLDSEILYKGHAQFNENLNIEDTTFKDVSSDGYNTAREWIHDFSSYDSVNNWSDDDYRSNTVRMLREADGEVALIVPYESTAGGYGYVAVSHGQIAGYENPGRPSFFHTRTGASQDADGQFKVATDSPNAAWPAIMSIILAGISDPNKRIEL